MDFKYIALLVALIFLDTLGRTLVKEAQEKSNVYYFGFSALVYLLVIIALYYTYSLNDFARTAAFWDSGTVITSIILGKYLFKETYKLGEWIAFGLIISGFLLLAGFS